jgi:hypothetical protein
MTVTSTVTTPERTQFRTDCVLRVDPVPSQVDRLLAGAVPQPSGQRGADDDQPDRAK